MRSGWNSGRWLRRSDRPVKSPLDLLSQPRKKPGKKPDPGEKDQPPA
jgi:hypothetical protein